MPPTPAKAPASAPDPAPAQPAPLPAVSPRESVNPLDFVLVAGALLILAGVLAVLAFRQIPQANLAIMASLASGMLGTVIGGYGGYRWGASDTLRRATTATQHHA